MSVEAIVFAGIIILLLLLFIKTRYDNVLWKCERNVKSISKQIKSIEAQIARLENSNKIIADKIKDYAGPIEIVYKNNYDITILKREIPPLKEKLVEENKKLDANLQLVLKENTKLSGDLIAVMQKYADIKKEIMINIISTNNLSANDLLEQKIENVNSKAIQIILDKISKMSDYNAYNDINDKDRYNTYGNVLPNRLQDWFKTLGFGPKDEVVVFYNKLLIKYSNLFIDCGTDNSKNKCTGVNKKWQKFDKELISVLTSDPVFKSMLEDLFSYFNSRLYSIAMVNGKMPPVPAMRDMYFNFVTKFSGIPAIAATRPVNTIMPVDSQINSETDEQPKAPVNSALSESVNYQDQYVETNPPSQNIDQPTSQPNGQPTSQPNGQLISPDDSMLFSVQERELMAKYEKDNGIPYGNMEFLETNGKDYAEFSYGGIKKRVDLIMGIMPVLYLPDKVILTYNNNASVNSGPRVPLYFYLFEASYNEDSFHNFVLAFVNSMTNSYLPVRKKTRGFYFSDYIKEWQKYKGAPWFYMILFTNGELIGGLAQNVSRNTPGYGTYILYETIANDAKDPQKTNGGRMTGQFVINRSNFNVVLDIDTYLGGTLDKSYPMRIEYVK